MNYLTEVAPVPLEKGGDGKAYYLLKESKDYRELFGWDTDYVIDPEECMADNFSYALIYSPDGSRHFPDPGLLRDILELHR